MIVLFLLIALVVLACLLALWASRLPGGVIVDLGMGASYEIGLVYALLALILLGAVMAVAWWLLTSLITLPARFARSRKATKTREANRALIDGLLAAEAGDAALARKLSKKANLYADDDRLKLLLEARAAEVGDDWSLAERAWGQLARLPGGKLAGLRGAASAATARGDSVTAQARAREALDLRSSADWPFNALFDSQVAAGDWTSALQTLSLGEKRGQIKGDSVRRRRAVLYTASAVTKPNTERREAQAQLAEAIRAAPGFPPAAWHGARQLMIEAKPGPAQAVLELGWKARPHPALAQLSARLGPSKRGETAHLRLQALIAANPDHRESRILSAELAMQGKDWLSAIKSLSLLIEDNPTARLCLLLEQALRGYGDAAEADRWGRMAVSAPREPEWSDIDPRGSAFEYAPRDLARLVYAFGDTSKLVHPRYEVASRELEIGRAVNLTGLYAPQGNSTFQERIEPPKPLSTPLTQQPLDYAPDED